MEGKLIIVSAPSGAGKTTIVKQLLERGLPLEFSISACSRSKRENEINGKDYYFLSVEDFKQKIENDEFVEWEEVYEGSYYGTLKTEIERIWQKGKHVLFDVDVQGGVNIKNKYKDKSLSVFIKPPCINELEKRLRGRGSETEESIKKRVAKANYEMTFMNKFDKIIVNEILEKAVDEIFACVIEFLNHEKA